MKICDYDDLHAPFRINQLTAELNGQFVFFAFVLCLYIGRGLGNAIWCSNIVIIPFGHFDRIKTTNTFEAFTHGGDTKQNKLFGIEFCCRQ